MNRKSFTLVELLVVIAVIGLLASIIIVNLTGTRSKANIAKGLQFSQSVHHALGSEAVGVWSFDEGSGTTANDASGYNNQGILTNGPVWRCASTDPSYTPLGQGCSIQFDGADDYVNMGNPTYFPVTGAVTLMLWAYPENYALGRQNPICKSYGGEFCMTMEPGSSINLYFGTAGGNSSPYISSNWPVGTLKNNKWIHLAWTKNPADNTVIAYNNGEIVQIRTCGLYCNTTPSSLNLLMGSGYAGRYIGLLDEVRIYNEALTSAQIQQYYAETAPKYRLVLE